MASERTARSRWRTFRSNHRTFLSNERAFALVHRPALSNEGPFPSAEPVNESETPVG